MTIAFDGKVAPDTSSNGKLITGTLNVFSIFAQIVVWMARVLPS